MITERELREKAARIHAAVEGLDEQLKQLLKDAQSLAGDARLANLTAQLIQGTTAVALVASMQDALRRVRNVTDPSYIPRIVSASGKPLDDFNMEQPNDGQDQS